MGSASPTLLPGGAFNPLPVPVFGTSPTAFLSTPDQLVSPVPGSAPVSAPGGAGSSIKAGSEGDSGGFPTSLPDTGAGLSFGLPPLPTPNQMVPSGGTDAFGFPASQSGASPFEVGPQILPLPGGSFIIPSEQVTPLDPSQTFRLPPQNTGSMADVPFPVIGFSTVGGNAFTTGPTPDSFTFAGQQFTFPPSAGATPDTSAVVSNGGGSPSTLANPGPDQPAQPNPAQPGSGDLPVIGDPGTGAPVTFPGATGPGATGLPGLAAATGINTLANLFTDTAYLFVRFGLVLLGIVLLGVAVYFLSQNRLPSVATVAKAVR